MKISMLKKALTFKLLQALSIQNSGRRHYISATHTSALKNNNNDADAMDWVDSNVYAQARVSTVRTGFQVPGITPEEDTLLPTADQPMCLHTQEKDQCLLIRRMDQRLSLKRSLSMDEMPFQQAPIQIADNIVTKLRDARDWAEASMATAKQDQEDRTNVHRDPAEQYKIGDLVWLNLKNIRTTRPSCTLDYRHARYKVIEVLDSHNYRLDTSPGIHDVFHTSLLRRTATDPFPSQLTSDWQPPGIIGEDNELEWEIENILDERPRGRS
ncbi:hypothetical protein, variant [Blastomyces dermatitidis ATCC 18188]|uniref:Uncharacterized protein n=1 Tax=Ajellomyces dermatitidis (strain ATCC 18188 / CBS 674.68) TaxID=653446 RepID=A0A0J9ERU6_AJEDA|nr:hypothetical protein, variant [Blastomyces dermatitidis ATCC 18188]